MAEVNDLGGRGGDLLARWGVFARLLLLIYTFKEAKDFEI